MLIDWYTVGAQIINFVILVWLLKRFLYRPILRAIDAREARIAADLSDAKETRAEAEREREKFENKNADLERQRDARLEEVTREANQKRHRLMDAARRAAEQLRAKQIEALRREQDSLSQDIVRRARDEVLAISRQALEDLANQSLESAMTDVFLDRLQDLDESARRQLADNLAGSGEAIRLRSAFPLPEAQQTRLREALTEALDMEMSIHFETAPEIIGGIELVGGGHKLGWSVEEYLHTLERHLVERIEAHVHEAGNSSRKPSDHQSGASEDASE